MQKIMKLLVFTFFMAFLTGCEEEVQKDPTFTLLEDSVPYRIYEGYDNLDPIRFLYQDQETTQTLTLEEVTVSDDLTDLFSSPGEYEVVFTYQELEFNKTFIVHEDDLLFDLTALYDLLIDYQAITHSKTSFMRLFEHIQNKDIISLKFKDQRLEIMFPSQEAINLGLDYDIGFFYVDQDTNELLLDTQVIGVHKIGELKPYHLVMFHGFEGEELTSEYVLEGNSASAPIPPTIEGHDFVSWSEDYTSVMDDISVQAVYEVKMFDVGMYDPFTGMVDFLPFAYGEILSLPPREGDLFQVFAGWALIRAEGEPERIEKDYIKITESVIVTPVFVEPSIEYFFQMPIELVVWHSLSETEVTTLEEIIDGFEARYPTINVRLISQGDNLRDKMIHSIMTNSVPSMVIDSIDSMMTYHNLDALTDLEPFIRNKQVGYDLSNLVFPFMQESKVSESYYSFPLYRTSDIILYNETLFDTNNVSLPSVLTFDGLVNYTTTLVGEGVNQCNYLLTIDNPSHLFHQMSITYNTNYITNEHTILIDEQGKAMLTYIEELFLSNTLAFPSTFGHDYGSVPFNNQETSMIMSSLSDIKYNTADNFTVGVLPTVKGSLEEESIFTYGMNIGILDNIDDYEKIASYMLMRYLLEEENQATLAIEHNYLPVVESVYQDDLFLDYLANDTIYTQALQAIVDQKDYFTYFPRFNGKYSSEVIEEELANLLEKILHQTHTVQEAIDAFHLLFE